MTGLANLWLDEAYSVAGPGIYHDHPWFKFANFKTEITSVTMLVTDERNNRTVDRCKITPQRAARKMNFHCAPESLMSLPSGETHANGTTQQKKGLHKHCNISLLGRHQSNRPYSYSRYWTETSLQ